MSTKMLLYEDSETKKHKGEIRFRTWIYLNSLWRTSWEQCSLLYDSWLYIQDIISYDENNQSFVCNYARACMLWFLKGQGHQGIVSLVKGTLWGNCKFLLEYFKGTKAMTKGHGGNRLCCLREVSGLPWSLKTNFFNKLNLAVFYEFWFD